MIEFELMDEVLKLIQELVEASLQYKRKLLSSRQYLQYTYLFDLNSQGPLPT